MNVQCAWLCGFTLASEQANDNNKTQPKAKEASQVRAKEQTQKARHVGKGRDGERSALRFARIGIGLHDEGWWPDPAGFAMTSGDSCELRRVEAREDYYELKLDLRRQVAKTPGGR